MATPDLEHRVLVRLSAEPGADRWWIAYPRGKGEGEAAVERLSPTVVKISHAEGTDYVLLAARHDRFAGQDVVLEGQAAAVRVSPRGVTLALMGGAGAAGYRGHVMTGVGPLERTLAAGELQTGVHPLRANRPSIWPINRGSGTIRM